MYTQGLSVVKQIIVVLKPNFDIEDDYNKYDIINAVTMYRLCTSGSYGLVLPHHVWNSGPEDDLLAAQISG